MLTNLNIFPSFLLKKWKSLKSEPIFKERIDNADKGIGEGLCYPEYEANLWSDGDRYRRQIGMGSISFEDFLKKIRIHLC